jgi:hypothetical protein
MAQIRAFGGQHHLDLELALAFQMLVSNDALNLLL